MIALFSITFAVSFFAMPVVYHHLQYPYRDLEKFKLRNHKFVKFDIVPAALTLYLGLDLGLDLGLKLGFPSINTDYLQSYVLLYPSHLSLYSSEKESDDMYTQLSSKSVCAD